GPRATTMLKIIVLGCVLAAIAITLKIRLDTPQGPQRLARAIRDHTPAKSAGRPGAALNTNKQSPLPAGQSWRKSISRRSRGGDSAAKLLSKDEARRIAANIAKDPRPLTQVTRFHGVQALFKPDVVVGGARSCGGRSLKRSSSSY